MAGIRDKVIVSCLALGDVKEGTLAALRYYHIKEDFERAIAPLHIHIEAEIIKGKYHDYDTFLGIEAVEYLKAYPDYRGRGNPRGLLPPDNIHDESPLLRARNSAKIRLVTRKAIYNAMCRLHHKAGLTKKGGCMYILRTHSMHKYFRNIYAAADLFIRPRTKIAGAKQLKQLVRILGYDPEKVLVKEVVLAP